jgi:Tol biopolymer transport system component
VISADGGTPRLLPVAEFNALGPSWMQNGASILFYDTSGAGTVMPGVEKLEDLKTLQVTTIPDSQNLLYPVGSPDGRYITAASVDGQRIMLFDFSTRKWSELLKASVGSTSWSQDSKYIYFDTGLVENAVLNRVRVADKKLERLADLKGFRRVVFAWIPWSGVTPDGAPLLLRDISSQEVYALDFETP